MKINLIGKEIVLNKESVIILAIVSVLALTVTGYIITNLENRLITVSEIQDHEPEQVIQTTAITEQKSMIQIYVTGCVVNPGIYELEKGQVIYDAITAAGGFTDEADRNINLVYKLYENVTLRIKSVNETQNVTKSTGIEIIKDHSDAILDQNGGMSYGTLININTASVSLLATLPGIGDATAAKIVEYREQAGQFKKIEDIMNVPGIKENKFEQIKNYITIE